MRDYARRIGRKYGFRVGLAARKIYAAVRAWCLDEPPEPADCG